MFVGSIVKNPVYAPEMLNYFLVAILDGKHRKKHFIGSAFFNEACLTAHEGMKQPSAMKYTLTGA